MSWHHFPQDDRAPPAGEGHSKAGRTIFPRLFLPSYKHLVLLSINDIGSLITEFMLILAGWLFKGRKGPFLKRRLKRHEKSEKTELM